MAGRWYFTGKSVRGATHIRQSRPNQDALAWHLPTTPNEIGVLAVADGHGSAQYVRSHVGAKLAAQIAIDLACQFGQEHDRSTLSTIKRAAQDQLPSRLVVLWREAVTAHLRRVPLRDEEAEIHLPDPFDPIRLYGSTLIVTMVAPHYLLFLQLGDGDILLVDAQGTVSKPPLPDDPRLLANETTSLCSQDAWRDVRVAFQPLVDRTPMLILAATDGYANSFVGEEDFFAVGRDLCSLIQMHGIKYITRRLGKWLHTTSERGSGDDITLGLAIRAI